MTHVTHKRRVSHIQRVISKAVKYQMHMRRGTRIHVYMYICKYTLMYIYQMSDSCHTYE